MSVEQAAATVAEDAAATRRRLLDLYQADEVAWLDEMADLARRGLVEGLDLHNLAEFLESMGRSARNDIRHRLRVLIAHILKWYYQPDHRSDSWSLTVYNQRDAICAELTATLRRHADEILPKVYRAAVGLAARETKLSTNVFPAECPFTLDQILTEKLVDDPADEES